MKPTFQELYKEYPRADSREKLFADLGWQDLIANKAYEDTCAIRLSTGLVRAGVLLPTARMKAKAGEAWSHSSRSCWALAATLI